MPYIRKESREKFNQFKLDLLSLAIETSGELNYVITKIILEYLYKKGIPKYNNYNEIVGVLECAKQELYRRQIAPYEDIKIKDNGDV